MKNAHLIGIGGIGMSALANLLLAKGIKVSGSDAGGVSDLTLDLEEKGVKISYNHNEENVPEECELIVYSEAIPETNPEREFAKNIGIKQISYGQALGKATKDFKLVLVVGTHGKTTVTGMLTHIALEEGMDPTVVIGSKMKELNEKNFRVGGSNLCIVEGCEYRRSFLNFYPQILVITNIEVDHLDYYKDEEDYFSAFKELIGRMREDGTIIINSDDENSVNLTKDAKCKVISFKEEESEGIKLQIPGKHNRTNAMSALKAAESMEFDGSKAIESFKGTWRRLELVGENGNTKIYDDYAHHPNEIKATLQALREIYPNEKICVVFQPHQVSRTKHFLDEFSKAFNLADEVILPDIYVVRDSAEDQTQNSTQNLAEKIGEKASYKGDLKEAIAFTKKHISNWDVLVLMGAGDISNYREELL